VEVWSKVEVLEMRKNSELKELCLKSVEECCAGFVPDGA
jgi:hypothetical protein